jgi:hypothetical protein
MKESIWHLEIRSNTIFENLNARRSETEIKNVEMHIIADRERERERERERGEERREGGENNEINRWWEG